MEEKKTTTQEFGKLLSTLLRITHQKSYALAMALSYDVSYISKWATGSMLPAARHIHTISGNIAAFLVNSVTGDHDESALRELNERYHTTDPDQLRSCIEEELLSSYFAQGTKKTKTESILTGEGNNSKTIVNPRMLRRYLPLDRKATSGEEPLKLAMMTDLLSLGKEDKLGIASIENSALLSGGKADTEVHYLISLDHEIADVTFDALLIAYLLSNYARVDFHISYYRRVPCSLLMAIRGYCSHMSLIARNHRSILSNTSMDPEVATETYDTILFLEESQTNPLVSYLSTYCFFTERNYLNHILSNNPRFLIGRMDETFLPDDLFEEFLERVKGIDKEYYRKLHLMQKTAMDLSNMRTVILDSALQDYVLSGKLDFYGYPVILERDEILRHLTYLRDLVYSPGTKLQLHIARSGIKKDFPPEFCPCFYLTDISSYIRLQQNVEDQICRLEEPSLCEIFNDFFEWLWTAKRIGTMNTESAVKETIQTYLDMLQLLK